MSSVQYMDNTRGSSRGLIRPYQSTLTAMLRVIDAAIIAGSLWASCSIYGMRWLVQYNWVAICAVALFLWFSENNGLYSSRRGILLREETIQVIKAWLHSVVGLLLLAYLTHKSTEYSRRIILTWVALAPVCLVGIRCSLRILLRYVRALGYNSRKVAIVGLSELAGRLAHVIHGRPDLGMELSGFYDDRQPNNGRKPVINTNLAPIRGGFDTLLRDARRGLVDVIYVVSPLRAEQRVKDLIYKLADTTASVYVVPDFFTFDLLRARWMSLDGIPAVSIHDTPFDGVDGAFKRMEDIIVASICLVVVAIPMVFIAIGIRLSSPGPILFKQLRYGINGEKIDVLKFRTMTVCENGASVNQATENDPRVTKLGRFLRRTSMDELPQFINVLQGQMSIVGPRPHAVAHNEEYRSLLQGYMLRHKVKPGITGWAQINGLRGETDTIDKMQMRLQYDLDYIRSWSPYFDLKIILRTIFIVVLGKNAY